MCRGRATLWILKEALLSRLDAKPVPLTHEHTSTCIELLTKVTHLMVGKTNKVTHLGASLSPFSGDARKGRLVWPALWTANHMAIGHCRNWRVKGSIHDVLRLLTTSHCHTQRVKAADHLCAPPIL